MDIAMQQAQKLLQRAFETAASSTLLSGPIPFHKPTPHRFCRESTQCLDSRSPWPAEQTSQCEPPHAKKQPHPKSPSPQKMLQPVQTPWKPLDDKHHALAL